MATIRPANVEDADAIGEVHVRAWRSAYRGMMPDDFLDGLHPRDHADRWRTHLLAPTPGAHLLVIVDGDRVVGFASYGRTLDHDAPSHLGQLHAINLDPDVWGQGLGRALVEFATERLRELGFVEAVLWVVPENHRARRLYERTGWRDDDLRRDDEVLGVVVPHMRYRKDLVGPATAPPRAPSR